MKTMKRIIKGGLTALSLSLPLWALGTSANASANASAAPTDGIPAAEEGFVLLEGGTVTLGSPTGERQRQADERQHQVTLSPFYVATYEVAQELYEEVMGNNPSPHQGDELPVENVSFYDAINFCNALSTQRGYTPVYTVKGMDVSVNLAANGYRLLTEAEWEYACRAGTTTVFNTGNQVDPDHMNYEGSYPYLIEENYVNQKDPSVHAGLNRGETIEEDELPTNAFGLYNMHGNVSEWVFDYYGEYADNVTNPHGQTTGSLRVNRGGGFNDFGKHLRSAYRSATNPVDTDENMGFRLARNAVAGEGTFATTYEQKATIPQNPRILIAYFSYTGNTENAAHIMHENLQGSTLVPITMKNPYRGNIYEVSQIDLNAGTRPELNMPPVDLNNFDVVLLGYPTWWATMPMPVVTFLESHDFAGKVVIPFSSHGGTIFGDSISDLSKTIQDAHVTPGFEFHYSGGSRLEDNINAFLEQNNLL